jgi:hypothetical protein
MVDEGEQREVQRFLRTGRYDHSLRIIFEMRIITRDLLAQRFQASVRRVTILLFRYYLDRRTPNHIRRRQVRLAQTKIDAPGLRAIEDLPDDTLLDSLQSFR